MKLRYKFALVSIISLIMFITLSNQQRLNNLEDSIIDIKARQEVQKARADELQDVLIFIINKVKQLYEAKR